MKIYRLTWIYTPASLLYSAGLPLSLWGWEEAGRPWLLTAALACFAAGMAGLWGIHGLLSWWHPGYQYPTSPDAIPVNPPGIRNPLDTPPAIGTRVLAPEDGLWYRAVVVGVLSRGRVLVRYSGWSEAWDRPHKLSHLQLDKGEQPEGAGVEYGSSVQPPHPPWPRRTEAVRAAAARKKRYVLLAFFAGSGLFFLGIWLVPTWEELIWVPLSGWGLAVLSMLGLAFVARYRCPRCDNRLYEEKEARYCRYCGLDLDAGPSRPG